MEQYIESIISTGEFSVTSESTGNTIKLEFEGEGYVVIVDGKEFHYKSSYKAFQKFNG